MSREAKLVAKSGAQHSVSWMLRTACFNQADNNLLVSVLFKVDTLTLCFSDDGDVNLECMMGHRQNHMGRSGHGSF